MDRSFCLASLDTTRQQAIKSTRNGFDSDEGGCGNDGQGLRKLWNTATKVTPNNTAYSLLTSG